MSYPQIIDYNEAVQNPRTAFKDPELQTGSIRKNNLGLPLALSGGFALTYSLTTAQGKRIAVRCFHRQVPEAETRYSQISKCLKSLNSAYFVDFAFQPQGIRVKQAYYPVVRMEWVDGDTLQQFLERNVRAPSVLARLRDSFRQLSGFLDKAGIAHGDLQNGNVMLSGINVRLVDYDGMYVPGLPQGKGTELGHKHFQHPKRTEKHFGPSIDRFSFICVDLSLQALIDDPSLHDRFKEGGETIIFKANDFAEPSRSEIFSRLFNMPALRQQAEWFAAICQSDLLQAPTLEDFLSGRNIPRAAAIVTKPEARGRAAYISAFVVLDASDFTAANQFIGQRVELIGCIYEVKPGTSRKGLPYLFLNFGPWKGEIVKITIWSEGLNNLAVVPDRSWLGQWVSVTGLIDPPYYSRRFDYTHIGITVTNQSQIQKITQAEARYRLGRETSSGTRKNRDILQGIRSGKLPPTQFPKIAKRPATANTANRAILEKMKQSRYSEKPMESSPKSQQPIQLQPSSRCFVAAAVFEDASSPFVAYLREYRDAVLSKRIIGRLVIKIYEAIGPGFARAVQAFPVIRGVLRPILAKLAMRVHNRMTMHADNSD
jgi:serine/threonine protein kinase